VGLEGWQFLMVSVDQFRQELTVQMGRASASGAKDVLINSFDLCKSIFNGNCAADSCCNAMQDEMKAYSSTGTIAPV